MVTWANWHYADFVRNWVEHVQSAGITSFLVGLQDLCLLCKLAAWRVACVLWVLLCLCPCPVLTGRIMAARTARPHAYDASQTALYDPNTLVVSLDAR